MPGTRSNNPAAAREAIADVQNMLRGLADSDAPRRILRPGIAAGLRVLARAIKLAAPVNRRRVKRANRRFAHKYRNAPLQALNAAAPDVRGLLQRSVGWKIKSVKGRLEGKAGLNVGKSPERTPNAFAPHAHLVTLGTKVRFHKSGKNVGRMTPNRFVRRAAAGAAPAAREAAIIEIKRQIDRQFAEGTRFNRKQGRAINILYSV